MNLKLAFKLLVIGVVTGVILIALAMVNGNDDRKESRHPNLESIQILSEPLSTADSWAERRTIIDRLPHYTRINLEALYETDRTSLGIVAPSEILDIAIEPAEREWKQNGRQH
jgi:hypothetical protein